MDPDRLKEIVDQLMKPVEDLGTSFNVDQSELLEEYLTEAGLRALDERVEQAGAVGGVAKEATLAADAAENAAGDAAAEPAGDEADSADSGSPIIDYDELGQLVEYSAIAYGQKVDLLYENVLSLRDRLNSTNNDGEDAVAVGGEEYGGKKENGGVVPLPFEEIELEPSEDTVRSNLGPAPPKLPVTMPELEPLPLEAMKLTPADLWDDFRKPPGRFRDFRVLARLQAGMLVDDLAMPLQKKEKKEKSATQSSDAPPKGRRRRRGDTNGLADNLSELRLDTGKPRKARDHRPGSWAQSAADLRAAALKARRACQRCKRRTTRRAIAQRNLRLVKAKTEAAATEPPPTPDLEADDGISVDIDQPSTSKPRTKRDLEAEYGSSDDDDKVTDTDSDDDFDTETDKTAAPSPVPEAEPHAETDSDDKVAAPTRLPALTEYDSEFDKVD